jgi:NAD(P)-dependent dehydrogenase (short-subunit alcohol dehydrogenase family)
MAGGGDRIDFTGQVALVTGAGRGLGRLYALDLARRGAGVVVNDLGSAMDGDGTDDSVADAVVEEIRAAGGTAVASHDSVATAPGAGAIVATATEAFGRIDAVVSNAGIFHTRPFAELTADQWDRMLRVHLDGAFHVSQAAYRVLQQQGGGGRFVFIASSAGLFGQPNSAHYAAAKSGTVGLANVIAIEGAEHGILANTVLPFGDTRMVSETLGGDLDAIRGFVDAIRPELVVPMVVYLASRACTSTHQVFSAGAGRFARVFVGLAEGWAAAPGTAPTAEDLAARLDEITASEPFSIPSSIYDEVAQLIDRLQIAL